MSESAQMQKLRRKAKKEELQIHKLTGKNLYFLADKINSVADYKPPMTIDQLKNTLEINQ